MKYLLFVSYCSVDFSSNTLSFVCMNLVERKNTDSKKCRKRINRK